MKKPLAVIQCPLAGCSFRTASRLPAWSGWALVAAKIRDHVAREHGARIPSREIIRGSSAKRRAEPPPFRLGSTA